MDSLNDPMLRSTCDINASERDEHIADCIALDETSQLTLKERLENWGSD